MRTLARSAAILIPILAGLAREGSAGEGARLAVRPVIPMKALPFPLEAVRLLPGPFERAMELNRRYLLSLDPDRLLRNFRVNAGLPSQAAPYGGWEEPTCELRGHSVGHCLSACALMYASTGDERLKEKGSRLVEGLAECQRKIGTGYLSAYPEEFIDRVEALARVWAPYYTLHKIYAGLIDMYVHCGDEQALEVSKRFGDWVIARNARLTDERMQAMLGNEHGGMNEALANLYAATGERKYLEIAQRFNHREVISPASSGEDRLTGLHANTQIPKFIGAARQYELTGEEWLKAASINFWEAVVKDRSYVIGGHSDGEHFSPKERLSEALGPSTTETCNTYNMLKLTRHLFTWDPRAEYADYYERALYNHILSSQNPEDGMMCYYVPLRSGSRKTYSSPDRSFWCCTGTGMENHAKYGDSIYFHDGEREIYVNLSIASVVAWKEKGVVLRQETSFPEESSTRLIFDCDAPVSLALCIRHPHWAVKGIRISVNGATVDPQSAPGSYAALSRTWKKGDVVQVEMPMTLRTEGFRDNPRRFAFLHGPLVLCAEVGQKGPFPAAVADGGDILAAIKPIPGSPSMFTGSPASFRTLGGGASRGIALEPFYRMHGGRHYMVYFDLYTQAQWKAREEENAAEQARLRELDARTVDRIVPGDEQSEREHKLQGERTAAGEFGGRMWRHATDGGWFSYEVRVAPDLPQELRVTYWGSDAGNRVFDVLLDGARIATQRLQNNRPNAFYDEIYAIPTDLARGKERTTIKFQAHPGAWAGGVFGVRVLKAATGP